MRKFLGFLLPIACGICLSMGAAQAANWKFNNGLPEGRGESKQLEKFAAEVSAKVHQNREIKT